MFLIFDLPLIRLIHKLWRIEKRIIGFELFEVPHTQAIYASLMNCIRKFKLRDKIMSFL